MAPARLCNKMWHLNVSGLLPARQNKCTGYVVEDTLLLAAGAGHAKVYNSNLDAVGALASIVGSNIDQQIKAHDQEQAAKNVPGNSFLAVQAPQLAPQPSVSSTFYGQPALLTQDSAPGEYSQSLGRKMLQQQAAGGVASSLASMGSQALGSLASKCAIPKALTCA